MPRFGPVARLIAVALVASAVAAVLGAWLHIEAMRHAGRQAVRAALAERVAVAAATLAPDPALAPDDARAAVLLAFEPFVRMTASAHGTTSWALVTSSGRLVATSDPAATAGLPWATVLAPSTGARGATDSRPPDPEGTPRAVLRASPGQADGSDADSGVAVWTAARALGVSGVHLVGVRPAYALPAASRLGTITALGVLWGVLALLLVAGGWWAGPRVRRRLAGTVSRLAHPETRSPEAVLNRADPDTAQLLAPLAARLSHLATGAAAARAHAGALYQVNPHPVLLVTMDGRFVEANPAFYATTGLAPEALHEAPVAALDDVLPLAPLMEMAERSLAEGASIGGLEYALTDADGATRPVEISLRAFAPPGAAPLLMVQATDVSARRTLERRVAAFSDALDLMVDQRVQQLAAGQQSLRRLMDLAGVAVASFDRGGTTRRWSGAMQALTGRVAADVPHVHGALAALGLPPDVRDAFGAWLWNDQPAPFAAVHAGADGRPRAFVWRRVEADRAGTTDVRTMVGMEVPVSVVARLAREALHSASGDGAVAGRVEATGTSLPHPSA